MSVTATLLSATVIAVVLGAAFLARRMYRAGRDAQRATDLREDVEHATETVEKITEARDAGRRARDSDLMQDDGFKQPPP